MKIGKQKGRFMRLLNTFINVLQTMTSVMNYYKNCVASVKTCWRLPHNLVFILQVKNGLHGKRRSKFHHVLKRYIMCYPIKITGMILTFHNFASIVWSILTRLNHNDVTVVCKKINMSADLDCVVQGYNSYKI